MQLAYDKLAHKFPNFEFQAFLMDTKGHCEPIDVVKTQKISANEIK